MIFGIKLIVALVILILPGEALLRGLAPNMRWGFMRPLIAFGIGQGVAIWCLWILGMLGIPMWSWGMGMVILSSTGCLCFFGWKKLKHEGGFAPLDCWPSMRSWKDYVRVLVKQLPLLILFLGAWFVAAQAATEALRYRIDDVAGLGNWAYKAKLLLMTESWPKDFFEYEAHNRRMGYPPGFPLLCAWCASFMGGLETHAIKLLPVVLTVATFLLAGGEMVRRLRWWAIPGLAGLMVLLLADPGRSVLTHFYAEPLLLFTAAVALVTLGRMNRDAGSLYVFLIAAGTMAWVKNEGILTFLLMAGAVFIFAKPLGYTRLRIAVATSFVALAVVVLWRIYISYHGWHDESFASEMFFNEKRWERLNMAWIEYRNLMFQHGSRFGGAWWLIPLLILIAIFKREAFIPRVIVITTISLIAVAILMMMGSAELDFEWHLAAAERVLLCPSLIILMSYAYLNPSTEQKDDQTKL